MSERNTSLALYCAWGSEALLNIEGIFYLPSSFISISSVKFSIFQGMSVAALLHDNRVHSAIRACTSYKMEYLCGHVMPAGSNLS